ncbi:MAG: leucine-rich repeat domain-containing protein, partial [Clostridia bacterium]|nr:leucine-rich repeat domain-containing protein [Clostridia bacterium]
TYEKDSQLTSIGRKAFSMQYEIWWDVEYFDYDSESKLTTLTVPEHVTTIGKSAFDNLTALRYLNWNAIECRDFEVHRGSIYSRTTVDGPFNKVEYATSTAGCKDGIIANFGSQVKKIPAATFYGVSNLISVSFGGGIGMLNRVCESIGDYAFYGCTGLFDLSLPVTLKTIGAYAFYECFSLINLYIPSTLTTVGNNAFYCPKLVEICNDSSITIHVGGSQTLEMNIYSSSSGSSKLFSYGMDGNDVYTFYQDGSTYYLMGTRDNTAHGLNLPQFVFKGNAKVSDTYIIHAYAFYGRNDDTIIISKPEAIAEIQSNAFNKIKNASVFFNGTAEKWNEMPRSFREALDSENTKYYYSETQPTEEGNFWRYYYGAIFIW